MRHKKKQSLTLLELMIALVLTGILLSCLISFYFQTSKNQLAIKELKKTVFPVELMRQRLNHLFIQAEIGEGNTPRLFSSLTHPQALGNALFLTYDYGIDPDPDFCGTLQGMLYLNRQEQLCLATFGAKETRQEVFLEGVSSLEFNFFDPKKKQWKSQWDKKDPPPPFFTFTWTYTSHPKDQESCAFFFPNADAKITYER